MQDAFVEMPKFITYMFQMDNWTLIILLLIAIAN